MKRLIDMVISLMALACLGPLLLLVALAVLATMGQPVLFRQTRLGLGGREFGMYKFRSMVNNAAAIGPYFTQDHDPRITRVGRFIRKTSIDELPQLMNVLMGDMTLVGPRPFPEYHLAAFDTAYRLKRCSVVPGLTGLWQVDRQDNGLAGQIELDTYYIDNLSLRLDAYIILKTIKTVVTFRNG